MKKEYKLQELDCANCAAKMERAVAKIDGVKEIKVNYMSQKLILDALDDMFEEILNEVEKAMKKIEKDICILR